jgi:hypothetical protein
MPLVIPGVTQQPSKRGETDEKQKASAAGGRTEKAQVQDYQANPGPVVPKDTKPFESEVGTREEREEKAEALNER